MQKTSNFEEKLSVLCTLNKNFDFKSISSVKIGPVCKYYAVVQTVAKLKRIIKLCQQKKVKFYVVGCASNILFCGSFFDGVVISLGMKKIFKNSAGYLCCYAGTMLPSVLNYCIKNGLSGLEWCVSIPASVGGAVCMNAGAFGGQICDVLKKVYVLNLKTLQIEKFDILEYLPKHHESVFTNNKNYVIISVEFCLVKKTEQEVKNLVLKILNERTKTQGVGFPSLGSVFKRGGSLFAPAFYIEKAGLKGMCVGDVEVSKVHSGYIVNKGNAIANDFLKLMEIIKATVKQKFGVELEPEIQILEDRL